MVNISGKVLTLLDLWSIEHELATQLITIYLDVCKHYCTSSWIYCQRMSHHVDLSFSGEEVITLYFFGIMDKNKDIKQISTAIFASGFPSCPATLLSFSV
jgi:hypothetical protein